MKQENKILSIFIKDISLNFEKLRLVNPKANTEIMKSIQEVGLLSPVVVGEIDKKYELIDGFKRFRACKQLNLEKIDARVLCLQKQTLKVLIISLNAEVRPIEALEEAMVIKSLKDEDNLMQIDIARLFRRDKSWVCRRLALIEKLSDKIINDIRLGILSFGIARELSRLPRVNQESAMKTIYNENLTCIESKKFIDEFLKSGEKNQAKLLKNPRLFIGDKSKKNNKIKKLNTTKSIIHDKLKIIDYNCSYLINQMAENNNFSTISKNDQKFIVSYFNNKVKGSFNLLDENFNELINKGNEAKMPERRVL